MEKEIVAAIIIAGGTIIAALIGTAFWRRRNAVDSNNTDNSNNIVNSNNTINSNNTV
ncbi:MAG: hypothetical protein LBO00_00530 [Zoogloeaceae bacterium]|jgi:hypothetical protein|nr:hypothetical protein [Zoogloeaceae bacterium]